MPNRFHLNSIFCHHSGVDLQAVDVSSEVLLAIAFVEVAETTKHKLGFFECEFARDFAEVVALK
jgi:hypothetical protein